MNATRGPSGPVIDGVVLPEPVMIIDTVCMPQPLPDADKFNFWEKYYNLP